MNKRKQRFVAYALMAGFAGVALAANGIAVKRGDDAMVYGNCVPSLVAVNGSTQAIDFLQVDVVLALAGGQERTVELRSAYRGGIDRPIAPGTSATLRMQLDLSVPLGAGCGAIASRRVARTICEAGGRDCAAMVSVRP
ncbi:MAG: hypothetical protein O2975_08680 [Proteobacteria bacterium]|nr:hypothetical protein [Pseudomonadota bacterium]